MHIVKLLRPSGSYEKKGLNWNNLPLEQVLMRGKTRNLSLKFEALLLAMLLLPACSYRKLESLREEMTQESIVENLRSECINLTPMTTFMLPAMHVRRVSGITMEFFYPVQGVKIWLDSLETTDRFYLAITDSNGRFAFDNVAAGRYELWTCLEGWDKLQMEIEVDPEGADDRMLLEMYLSG